MVAQIIWIISSILIAIALVGGVVILVVFAALMVHMDNQKRAQREPLVEEPVFEGPSRLEMEMTTARLLREDKCRPRKRHAQVIIVR